MAAMTIARYTGQAIILIGWLGLHSVTIGIVGIVIAGIGIMGQPKEAQTNV